MSNAFVVHKNTQILGMYENDWDPYEIEDNCMLDLSGYSYYTKVGSSQTTLSAGTYIAFGQEQMVEFVD